MKKFWIILITVSVLFSACKTIDIEKSDELEEVKKEETPVVIEEPEYEVNGVRIKESEFVYNLEPVIVEKKEYIVIDKSEIETILLSGSVSRGDYFPQKKENGEYESIPSFIDCQCKGPYAESMSKHLLKGRRITVSGKLKQQRWTDDQGVKHSAIVVRVNEISLTPFGNNSFRPSEESQQNEARKYESENYQPDNYDSSMFDDSEEIPFPSCFWQIRIPPAGQHPFPRVSDSADSCTARTVPSEELHRPVSSCAHLPDNGEEKYVLP